ncbi:hypothetical protein HYC85_019899 [Camellia sinensis]|uniref:Polygalacturonase n=1 Tax=Camellia sinensis TaxID=4442 RepID=A0A7J7GP58_CAMSI|nr:hypothetical protein HYC85_019899 [Camellia sinensis]
MPNTPSGVSANGGVTPHWELSVGVTPLGSSGVKVSQVTYSNIKGTSSTPVAVTFNCSPSNPCRGIRMRDVQLTFENRPATSFCTNAGGTSSGTVIPKSCLYRIKNK